MSDLDRITDLVLDRIQHHAPGAEAVVAVGHDRHGLARFANSFVHQHVGDERIEVTLKIALGGRVLSAGTSNPDDDALDGFIAAVAEQVALLPVDPHWAGVAPPQELPEHSGADASTWDAGPDDRARQVRAFIDAGEGLQAAGYVDTSATDLLVATSAGQVAAGRSTRATVDGIQQTGTSAGFGHQTSPRFADLDGGAVGAGAADLARRCEHTTDVEPGEYEVVLSPDCVAEVLASLGLYGFNAKEHLEGQSFAVLGEAQFDQAVHLVDDATDPRAVGFPFDAEGTPKQSTTLIDHGVTASLCHDRRTAARSGTTSTGHAVPGGEAWGTFPEHLFLTAGDTAPADLIAGVDRGLLVTSLNYVRILDPKTQVSTGLTRNGTFLIEDGEVTRPVSTLRFTQSFVQALGPGNVVALGNDARFGACESGEGLVHAPSVRLGSFRFTGGAAG
ncbi:MAG TPA: metallopeptidase TldD-related protein [Nitriliruptorales bacterium]